MKKYLLWGIALFFGFVISLELRRTSVPDIFWIELFLIVALYLGILAFSITKVYKIKRKAEEKYKIEFAAKSIFDYLILPFVGQVSLCGGDGVTSLAVVFVHRKNARYHFDSESRIEIYVGNRESYRVGKVRFSVGKSVTWTLKRRINLRYCQGKNVIYVLTKSPMELTSSDKAANEYLLSGDMLFNTSQVYSYRHFVS